MPCRFPVALEVRGRRCVVVGGGPAAEARVHGLLAAEADVVVVAASVTAGLDRLAEAGEITIVRRPYAPGDLRGTFLVMAAGDHRGVHAQVFVEAQARGVLMNAMDDVAHCDFAVPSVLRRGELTVAVSTGGRAPALSRRLKAALAEELGPEMGELVELLGRAREEARAAAAVDLPTAAARWEAALDHDLLGLVRAGRLEEAGDLVRACLTGGDPAASDAPPGEGPSDGPALGLLAGPGATSAPAPGPAPAPARAPTRAGRVSIVGAGPGDPKLITVRGRELLDQADVVVHDRLVDPSLLAGRRVVPVGKSPGHHPVPQEEINALLVDLARQGHHVVRLKGGDPFVFGRGGEEADALARAGVEFEVVPAPTSAVAALAAAGIPVTDRRFASSVAVVTGHCAGTGPEVRWQQLATAVDTLVVLMGLGDLPRLVGRLLDGGRHPATPAAIVERGTTPGQRVVEAQLVTLPLAAALAGVRSPAIVVVGEVVRLRHRLAPREAHPSAHSWNGNTSERVSSTARLTSSASPRSPVPASERVDGTASPASPLARSTQASGSRSGSSTPAISAK